MLVSPQIFPPLNMLDREIKYNKAWRDQAVLNSP